MPVPPPATNPTAPRGPISSSAPPMFRVKKRKPGEVNPTPNNQGRLTGPPMQMGAGKGSMFADGRKPSYGQPQGNLPATPNYPTNGPGPSRVAGQPQYGMPPTPNYPMGGPGPSGVRGQAQGSHPAGVPTSVMLADGRRGRGIMMANGGDFMGNPTPIGGMPDDMGDQAAGDGSDPSMAQGPDSGSSGPMPVISPEAVAYHDQAQSCSTCQYFGQDGQCAVLQMAVASEGGCNAWSGSAGGPDDGSGGLGDMSTGADQTQNPNGTSGGPSLS